MVRSLVSLTVLMAAATFAFSAPEKDAKPTKAEKPIYIDPKAAEADPDFKVQGEYLHESDSGAKVGAQVVALGGGDFLLSVYPGGLPGAGWDGKEPFVSNGKRTKDFVEFNNTKGHAWEWRNGMVQDNDMKFKKVARTSPTMGMKPPKDAIVLFDGSNADHWKGGKVDDRGLLVTGCTSKKLWQSFILHMEFRTPYKPFGRGQDRGNAGCYIQRRYEVQILDSFGLKGEANECGGLYRQKAPDVNMALPPLTWQTYDIHFNAPKFDENGKKLKPAKITVVHNGVKVHDNYELKNKTGAGQKEGPTPGPIYLQGHGNPVFYRNIWILEK